MAPSPKAQALLDDLRARFKLKLAEPTSSTDDTLVTRTYEVLLASDADRIDALSNSLTPHLASPARGTARTPSLALPKAATGAARVSEAASGLYVDVQPAGLAAAAADVADGYVVYASARSPKEHLLRRITADGVEDFENFESAPASPDVSYDLALSPKVAGLRLVGNSLELLDSAGAPRLRVPSPYLVDATGARIDATLAVTGCNVDTSPAAPWGRAVTAPGAAHCTLKVSWDGSKVTYPALLDPSWTTTGSMPNTQADHKGVLLQSGKTLVIGPNFGNGCFLYDPPSGTWSTTGSPVKQRSNAVVAVLQDGRVLLAGGYNGGTQNTAELYNPASGTWSGTGTMVSKIEQGTGNLLANGKVLVAGGFKYVSSTNRNYTAEAELFNPATGTWALTGSMPSAHAQHASGLLPNGKVIVVSGVSAWPSDTGNATATVYDPTSGTWAAAGTLPAARYRHAATVLPYGGKVLASGGLNPATLARLNTTALYDPVANTWSSGPTMSAERVYHGTILLPNSKVLLAGGETNAGRTSSVDLYDPQSNTISATASMSIPRSNFTVTVAGDPTTTWPVLAAGGYTPPNNSTTATAELFDVRDPQQSFNGPRGDGLGMPAVTVTWSIINPTGSVVATSTLSAFVSNNTSTTRYVHVDLVGTGLDDRIVRRASYTDFALAANTSQNFQVTVGAFPVQSVGSEAEIVLSAREYTPAGGDTGLVVPSTPLYVEFVAGYATASLHGIDGKDLDRVQPTQSTTQAQLLASLQPLQQGLLSRSGRIFDVGTGGWLDVTTLAKPGDANMSYSLGYVGRGQWAKDIGDLKPGFTMGYVPPVGSPSRKVCAEWSARFTDANANDDYLKLDSPALNGRTRIRARYASAFITTSPTVGPSDIVWSGTLDANGCATAVMGPGDFDLFWLSDMTSGSTGISLSLGANGMSGTGGAGFAYPSATPFQIVTFNFPDNSDSGTEHVIKMFNDDFVTRVASVMALILSNADTGLISNWTYKAEVNNGCPDIDDGGLVPETERGGCYDTQKNSPTFDRFLVGYSRNKGTNLWQHTSLSKYVIAHEFGHNVHFKQMNTVGADAGFGSIFAEQDKPNHQRVSPGAYACRCDYVYATNGIHCLQSREVQGFANEEGFAHAYAAQLFNNPSETDCSFVYYKEKIFPSNDFGWVPHEPPNPVDCYSPVKWMDQQCAQGDDKMGNEWDWLGYFYKVHRTMTSPFTYDEIGRIYRRACFSEGFGCAFDDPPAVLFNRPGTGIFRFNGNSVPAGNSSMVEAACAVVGGGSCDLGIQRFKDFRDLGFSYGVDH